MLLIVAIMSNASRQCMDSVWTKISEVACKDRGSRGQAYNGYVSFVIVICYPDKL